MPLVAHLDNNVKMEKSWHRQQERRSRGLSPVASGAQFESWEKQLIVAESLLLYGVQNSHGCYRSLAHAWGRKQGFHNVLLEQFFDRRGEIERKKRSDAATDDRDG
jgi:hypothetical protein